MSVVIDYAWSHPSIATIKAVGGVGVARYLSNDSAKNLSASEYKQLRDNNLAVTLVWETTANRALSGYNGGAHDAKVANQQADALNYPVSAAIYFAVDFEANTNVEMAAVLEYIRGANDNNPRPTGVYGSYYVVEACAKHNIADYFWQTMAWSGGHVSGHHDLLQVVQGSTPQYDINHIGDSDWGQDSKQHSYPPFPLTKNQAFGKDVNSGHGLDTWQNRMVQRGWSLSVDGVYGPETKGVATKFQQEKGLIVDGLIGIRTWNAAWTEPVT